MKFVAVLNVLIWSINTCLVFVSNDKEYLNVVAKISTFTVLIAAIFTLLERIM